MMVQASKGLSDGSPKSQVAGLVADPPLTIKVNNGLDEIMSRLAKAQAQVDDLNCRLFGDSEATGNPEPDVPEAFSAQVGDRLHRAIGSAGDLLGAINRLSNRL